MPTSPDETRKIVLPGDPPRPEPTGTLWDKQAPKGPPTVEAREIPAAFEPIARWLEDIVAEEGLVADLALERAIKIVEWNHNRGLVGIDYFPEAGNGQPFTRTTCVALAVPLAVEIYKQALVAIERRKDELEKLVKAAKGPVSQAGRDL